MGWPHTDPHWDPGLWGMNTGSFTFDSVPVEESQNACARPGFPIDCDRERQPLIIHGTVPEWTLDAVGWTIGACAEACREAAIRTRLLLSVAGDRPGHHTRPDLTLSMSPDTHISPTDHTGTKSH